MEEEAPSKPFCADRAKQGRAACKKCKAKLPVGSLRVGKLTPSPFGSGLMKQWFHMECLFEQFLKQRPNTKRLDDPSDLDGWDALNNEDQTAILEQIEICERTFAAKTGQEYTPKAAKKDSDSAAGSSAAAMQPHSDDMFRSFIDLVEEVAKVSSYKEKTSLIQTLFGKGTDKKGFRGDIVLWCSLLLPTVQKRMYNLQSKQIVKLFSRIFTANPEEMLDDLEKGDVADTIGRFFLKNHPATESTLTIQEVEEFLEELSHLTREDEQIFHFRPFVKKCTPDDLKMVIRLIKHDLRMNAGPKHVLGAIHPTAFEAWQSCQDLKTVVRKSVSEVLGVPKDIKTELKLMCPVIPMLAEASKSFEHVLKRCPDGMLAETKYDGERVQLHKQGNQFKYFSRNLRPVMPHKVAHLKDYIPKAFPDASDLILDSEILVVDTETGRPLPFGTLGVHKKEEAKGSNVCLFVFDCLYYNGEGLLDRPIKERRSILQNNIKEVRHRVMLSEVEEIHDMPALRRTVANALQTGLEGVVLKGLQGGYEPGKRRWLKIKKDYLFDGAMADSADLLVLGAWFGTGKKGGMMSVFLMGCRDPQTDMYLTVTKVHTGMDDKTVERLQSELDMVRPEGEGPRWLRCTRSMLPDLVARDPRAQPVWEVVAAEFTKHDIHTADGISMRFPRVVRHRPDKDWATATTLEELRHLYEASKSGPDVSRILQDDSKPPASPKAKKAKKAPPEENGTVKRPLSPPQEASTPKKAKRAPRKKTTQSTSEEDATQTSPAKKVASAEKEPEKPQLFNGVFLKVARPDEIEQKVLQLFAAYGGVILEPQEWREATHVLHSREKVQHQVPDCPLTARHVIYKWITHSVIKNELQPTRLFTVILQG